MSDNSELVPRDMQAFEAAVATGRTLLLKHSPICPISTIARAEWELFRVDNPDVPTMFVNVVASRALAREIADTCGVKHESPQVILFEDGKATWHASHDAITKAALEAAWAPRC